MGSLDAAPERGRVRAIQDWLRGRTDTALGRLAAAVVPRLFRGEPQLGVCGDDLSALSVLPAVLVAIAYFHPSGSDANARFG
jgi:hypothetical protein